MTKRSEWRKQLAINSDNGGTVLLTMTGADISPAPQPCQSCLVQRQTGSTALYLNLNTAASPSTFLLIGSGLIPIPVLDLSQLHFYGASTDVIQVLWRS